MVAQAQPDAWRHLVDYVDQVWLVDPVDPVAVELCRLRMGQLGPPSILESVRSRAALDAGMRESDVQALPQWPTAPAFNAATRAALHYAEQVTLDAKALDEETSGAVVRHFGDTGYVRLALAIGLFDGLARLVTLLGLTPGDRREPMVVGSLNELVTATDDHAATLDLQPNLTL